MSDTKDDSAGGAVATIELKTPRKDSDSFSEGDTPALETRKKKSLWARINSHLDWNEQIQIGTNKPEGRTWTNVAEVVLNAMCAGYYQGYCHQKYGIFPGTMTGNSWSAMRAIFDGKPLKTIFFKISAIICWFVGNYTGMEIMRNMTQKRAVCLKWLDIVIVTFVACLELEFGTKNDFDNPVKNLMMVISFGSGMSTVYFRLIYGVVTNRLTGNVYRLARGAQDLTHGTNDCPNAALTLGICFFFLFGLYFYYAPWSSDIGLFLPVIITAGWEVIETIYETVLDDGFVEIEGQQTAEQAKAFETLENQIGLLQEQIDHRNKHISMIQAVLDDKDGKTNALSELNEWEDNQIAE